MNRTRTEIKSQQINDDNKSLRDAVAPVARSEGMRDRVNEFKELLGSDVDSDSSEETKKRQTWIRLQIRLALIVVGAFLIFEACQQLYLLAEDL